METRRIRTKKKCHSPADDMQRHGPTDELIFFFTLLVERREVEWK